MEDRPNARREPSAKQIASIRRALQERDVTPEEFNDIRDKIGRGLDSEVSISFDEASEILNDLKSRPITNIENLLGVMEDDEDLDGLRYILDKPEYAEFRDQILESIENLLEEMGIEPDLDQDTSSGKPTQQEVSSLLDSLALEQDVDGLKALLDNPNYSEFRDDIRDTIQTLRRDQGTDQDFDPDLDQDVDLDQDATPGDTAKNSKLGTVLFPHKTAQVLEGILDEKLKRLRAEGASPEQIEKLSKLASQMRSIRLRDRKWGEVSPPDFINFTPDEAREALSALEEYLAENPDSELAGLGGRSLQKSGESFEDYNNRNKNIKENALPDLKEKLESLANGSLPTPKKRPPTDKQIASIRRGALERGLSEEEAAAILDRVDDLSFDDASKIISDLKARPITDGGIDNLVNNSELDVLESIVDRPDYAPWKDKIQSKIDEINSSPDLDQDINFRSLATDWDIDTGVLSGEEQSRYDRDITEVVTALTVGHAPSVYKLRDKVSKNSELTENVRSQLLDSINTWAEYDSEVVDLFEDFWDEDDNKSEVALRELRSLAKNDGYRPWRPLLEAEPRSQEEYNAIVDELGKELAAEGVDLNQDVPSSVSRDDLANKLAEDIDAEDIFLVDGDTIKEALKFFDEAKFTFSAGDMVKEIYEMANDLDNRDQPELAKRARELADRMFDEMLERFGFGDAGRYENGLDPVDLDDAQNIIRDEREMFFETDVEKIIDAVDRNGSYGDSKSGGADVRVRQEEDGTWTAFVDYDLSDEQFTGSDRDEVVRQAAEAAADYNSDVIPSSYQEDADLSQEASEARTPEQASAFADKLDAIAADLDANRGDPRLANNLRDSAESIRDAVARREAQNLAGVPDEPTTPETMDEMATDPDVNPRGYAQYIGEDIAAKISENVSAYPAFLLPVPIIKLTIP
jgi:nucleotide-binding universal stress UspA family protein